MYELATIIAEKTGTTIEASSEVVRIMVEYLDQRLPEPLALQVQEILRLIDKSYELSATTPSPATVLCE